MSGVAVCALLARVHVVRYGGPRARAHAQSLLYFVVDGGVRRWRVHVMLRRARYYLLPLPPPHSRYFHASVVLQ